MIAIHEEHQAHPVQPGKAPPLSAPYDDPIHYLTAVINGQIQDGDDPSSLKTNVIATEILDAAWRSSQTGKTVELPLKL